MSLDSTRISNLVSLFTAVAVLAGLGLVVFELKLLREEGQAQATSDNWAIAQEINTAMFGEGASIALAKACTKPEELTDDELVVLFHYYQSYWVLILRAYGIERRSGLYEGQWKQVANGAFSRILSTSTGQAWWRAHHSDSMSPIVLYVNQIHDDAMSSEARCSPNMERWKTEMGLGQPARVDR